MHTGRTAFLASALVSTVIFASCVPAAPSAPNPTAAPAQAPLTLKIGIVTPLSAPGDYQSGTEIRKADEFFVNWWNQNNKDVNLQIVGVEDDKGSPATGAAGFERLIQNGAVTVVGDDWGAVTLAEIPVAVKYGVPFVVGSGWADSITADHNRNVFRVGLYDSLGAQKAIQYFKDFNIKNVAMLSEDTDHGKGFDKGLRDEAKAQGWDLNLTTRFVPSPGNDMTADLVAIKNLNPKPQILVIDIVTSGHYTAINQAFEVGVAPDAQIVGQYNFPENPDFWQVVGQNGVGIQYMNYAPPDSALTDIGKQLVAANGSRPQVWGLWQWDVLLALVTAARDAKSVDKDKLIDALENVKFTGPTGEVSFPKNGQGIQYHQRQAAPFYVMQFAKQGDGFAQAKVIWPKQ